MMAINLPGMGPLPATLPDKQSPPPADQDPIHSRVVSSSSQYEKLLKVKGNIDAVRRELTSLLQLGDIVDSDDVVKASSRLVAHGLDPKSLAPILAEMPPSGEALQQWLQGHVGMMEQKEAELQPMIEKARYQMGVSGLHSILVHGGDMAAPSAGSALPGMNPAGRA